MRGSNNKEKRKDKQKPKNTDISPFVIKSKSLKVPIYSTNIQFVNISILLDYYRDKVRQSQIGNNKQKL